MSLIDRMETELKEAMLEQDNDRRDALRLILASLRSAAKDLQRPLSDDEELQVLQRERKRRVEAAEAFRSGEREEQAEKEERELAVLEEFMPTPLSEEELEDIIDDVIAEVGATNLRQLGRVMADVMPQVAGRADGSFVSQLGKEKLAERRRAKGVTLRARRPGRRASRACHLWSLSTGGRLRLQPCRRGEAAPCASRQLEKLLDPGRPHVRPTLGLCRKFSTFQTRLRLSSQA